MAPIPPHIIAMLLSQATMMKLSLAKDLGVSALQLLALVLLGTIGSLSIKTLKDMLSIPGSTLTSTLDSLEKNRLIKRQRSKEDRRQWLLSLSSKGKRLYSKVLKANGEALSPALERLSESERTAFLKIVEEVFSTAHWKKRLLGSA
jgi:DNA-binding MarR family transcriptional regulator